MNDSLLLRAARLSTRLCLCAGVAVTSHAWGQPGGASERGGQPEAAVPPVKAGDDDPAENRVIREIELRSPKKGKKGEFVTLEDSLAQLVSNQLRSRAGSPFLRQQVTDDITRINRLARFKQVDARVLLLDDGSVKLIFTLSAQPVIADVQIAGNKKFTDAEVLKQVDVLTGTPIDDWEIDRAARRIEDLYRAKGYYLARVKTNADELAKANVVLFEITEGERVRVMGIKFDGNRAFAAAELRQELKTREAWLLDSGPLDTEVVDQDVGSLVKYYKDRGYLNARVDKTILASPDGKEAQVTFVIDEDVVYTLRNVEVEYSELKDIFTSEADARGFAGPSGVVEVLNEGGAGAQKKWAAARPGPFATAQIKGLMTIKSGDVYSANALDRSVKAIEEACGQLGFTDAEIVRRELRDTAKPLVDVLIVIRGVTKSYKVGEVINTGHPITKDKVIRRQVELLPDRPADKTKIDSSVKRIEGTGLFNSRATKITFQSPTADDPDHRDVLVQVEEKNTGALIFGGVVGSDGGLNGQISFKQNNFDIAALPDTAGEFFSGKAFRGAGQQFSLDFLPGTLTQTYSVSVTEPYFLETNTSISGSAYFHSREFREYTEVRGGGRMGFGRRLGTRWNASLSIRGEQVELRDLVAESAVDYFRVADAKVLTGVGISLARTTIDDFYVPTKGSRLEFAVEQVGMLGGDFTYSGFKADYASYFTLYEDYFARRTVLSLNTRVSYIPQSVDDVPVYERFYLGGQDFRGFGLRTIAPRGIRNDTGLVGDDPVGGNFLFFLGAQVRQPLFEDLLSSVFFVDTGTVNAGASLDQYRASVGAGIRLHVPQLTPVPLAFDFGFPVKKEKSDRKRLFTFFVDVPF